MKTKVKPRFMIQVLFAKREINLSTRSETQRKPKFSRKEKHANKMSSKCWIESLFLKIESSVMLTPTPGLSGIQLLQRKESIPFLQQ